MKHFIVEGMIRNPERINDEIMKEHMQYTQKAMNSGLILVSGLKSDMTGGIFMMKSESIQILENYLKEEPFKVHGIQDYKITEFSAHYFNQNPDEWFNN